MCNLSGLFCQKYHGFMKEGRCESFCIIKETGNPIWKLQGAYGTFSSKYIDGILKRGDISVTETGSGRKDSRDITQNTVGGCRSHLGWRRCFDENRVYKVITKACQNFN